MKIIKKDSENSQEINIESYLKKKKIKNKKIKKQNMEKRDVAICLKKIKKD